MTDYDAFLAMLKRANTNGQVMEREEYIAKCEHTEWVPGPRTNIVVRVHPGYRAHFEAEFDAHGNMLSIGQWESL